MSDNREIAIKISNVKKMYKLGQIGGATLQADLQSWWARKRGKEDPNVKIGQEERARLVGQTFMALNGIDLTIYKGEAVGIIGSNGAGKSTMLKLLSRVTAPTSGEIDIYGRITSMLEVGTGFNGEMTGRENVYLNGAILGMTKAEIDAKMEQIIEFSEVRDFIDTPVKRYSSGMYVKLAFSVAAHLDSEIMIMDEVLAVGDMAFQKKCLDKMRDAATKEGKTVLYVSHNMNTIRKLCDRCIVLDKGKVIFDGDVEEAISIYLGSKTNLSNTIEFTKSYHSNKNTNNNLQIKKFSTKNNTDLSFKYGEKIYFDLSFESKMAFNDIGLRFEFRSPDGFPVGVMFLKTPLFFEANATSSFTFCLDLDNLAPSSYIVNIVAYSFDDFGNEVFIDGVYPGFYINITSELTQKNKLIWLPREWGYLHLSDAIMLSDQ